MLKKVLIWGLLGFIAFCVAFRPSAAKAAWSAGWHTVFDILQGVGEFFSSLVT